MNARPDFLFANTPIPDETILIHQTFVNREQELRTAQALFRPNQLKNQIYAIHGNSRVGKSHLAIKLAQDMVAEHGIIFFYISANMRGSSIDVLEGLFELVCEYIESISWQLDDEKSNHLRFLELYLAQIRLLFMSSNAKIAVRHLQKEAKKIKSGFSGKIPFLNFGSEVSGESARGKDEEQTIEIGRPDVRGVRLILCFLLDQLAFIAEREILILVDDLDLLEEASVGKKENDELINHLKPIVGLKPVAVWVTSRQQYFIERGKEMFDFIKVRMMAQTELIDIYKARVKHFNGDQQIFTQDVLEELTNGFRGVAGSFLTECYQFWRYHLGKPYPLGVKQLSEYLSAEIDDLLRNPETSEIFEKIRTAVVIDKKTEITIKDVKKGHGLIYRVLLPKAYGQDTYEIIPLFAKVIKNQASHP